MTPRRSDTPVTQTPTPVRATPPPPSHRHPTPVRATPRNVSEPSFEPSRNRYVAVARDVLSFLNEKTGRNFRPTDVNLRLIESRLKEGFSEQELRAVVARKVREWTPDDKMREYLRPATLFNREKFSQYIGDVNVQVS